MKFSQTMKLLRILDKMNFDINMEITDPKNLGMDILKELILKIPRAEKEFLDFINEMTGNSFTPDTDIVEIIPVLKEFSSDFFTQLQSAFKLKNMI